MQPARRYDAAPLGQVRRDSRGFLEVPAFLTRTGVFAYRRADGTTVRELRPPDEVFRADSLATLRRAPVTVGHPADFVSPDNARELEVGHVDAAQQDGKYVAAEVSIRRADAISKVHARELVEISLGYTCRVDATSGVYEDEPYDQVQRDIQYNHAALLQRGKGRAGRDVGLRLDADDAEIVDDVGDQTRTDESSTGKPPRREETRMRKVRIDGVEYEIPDPAAAVVEKLQATHEADKRRAEDEKKRADAAEAERDLIKTDLAKATDPKVRQDSVQARVLLERTAGKVLGDTVKLDALSDRQIREKVLQVSRPEFVLEGRSDDAVSAAFDFACVALGKTNQGLQLVQNALAVGTETRADDHAKILADLEEKRRTASHFHTKKEGN